MKNSTICARATAPGNAGIAIIRISGDDALKVFKSVFKKKGEDFSPRYMYLGEVVSNGETIDRALGVYFPAPNSYTGEDICEIHLHGGMISSKMTLNALLGAGAVPAEPGEFSKRAFLNGKMDVSQAEAVQDLIGALTEGGAKQSIKQLKGSLKNKIDDLNYRLTDCIAAIEAGIEYPEEDIEEALALEQLPELEKICAELDEMIRSYGKGKLLREGAQVSIAGLPNAGKSSLLNRILGEERAIVTEIAGTTRDTVAEFYDLDGVPVKFIDTAGIREAKDAVEKIGVERSFEAIKGSVLVLMLIDAQKELDEEDVSLFNEVKAANIPVMLVLNKCDGKMKTDKAKIKEKFACEPIEISARTGENVEALLQMIKEAISFDDSSFEGTAVASLRHFSSICAARQSLADAISQIGAGVDLDCMSIDLRAAWQSLGEITGETLTEDIIDRIFSKFCLGK